MNFFRSRIERTREHIAELEDEMNVEGLGTTLPLDDSVMPPPPPPPPRLTMPWEERSGAFLLLEEKAREQGFGVDGPGFNYAASSCSYPTPMVVWKDPCG